MKKLILWISCVFVFFTCLLSGMSDSQDLIDEILLGKQEVLKALTEHNFDIVQLLLENGALCVSLSELTESESSSHHAPEIPAQLLELIKFLHDKSDYATANRIIDCARLLILYGASIDTTAHVWPTLAELMHFTNPSMWFVINDKKDTLLIFLMIHSLLCKNYMLAYTYAQEAYKRAETSRRMEKFKKALTYYKTHIQTFGYSELLKAVALLEEEIVQGSENRKLFEVFVNSPEFSDESARYDVHELNYILGLIHEPTGKSNNFLDMHTMLIDACMYAASHFSLTCLKLLALSLKEYSVFKRIIPALATRWRLNAIASRRVLEWLLLVSLEKQLSFSQDSYYTALYKEVFKNKGVLLSKAAGTGCITVVRKIVQDSSINNLDKNNALDFAITKSQALCVRELLIHGACVPAEGLRKALTQRSSTLIQILLEHGAGPVCFPACSSIRAYDNYIATLTQGEKKIHRLLIAYGGIRNHISFAKRVLGNLLFTSKSLIACLGNKRIDLFMFLCVHNLLKGNYKNAYQVAVFIRKYVDFKNEKTRKMLDKLRGRLSHLFKNIESPSEILYLKLLGMLFTPLDFPHYWLKKAYYDTAAKITTTESEHRKVHHYVFELTYEQAQKHIDACLIYALGQAHRMFVELLMPYASSQGIRDALTVTNSIIRRFAIYNTLSAIGVREYLSLRNLLEEKVFGFYKRFFIGKKTEPSIFIMLPDEVLLYILRLTAFSSI